MQGLERGGNAPGDAGALAHDLQGFHPLNAGIAFRDAFRWGLRGDFLRFTAVRPRRLAPPGRVRPCPRWRVPGGSAGLWRALDPQPCWRSMRAGSPHSAETSKADLACACMPIMHGKPGHHFHVRHHVTMLA